VITAEDILQYLFQHVPGTVIGIALGIVIYRMYFNWQKELQAETRHLEEIKDRVINPLLIAMEEITLGSFPKCSLENGKIIVSLAQMSAARLALERKGEILRRFSNELLNDLVKYHVPKLGELLKKYCEKCRQKEENTEEIEKTIKELTYKQLAQSDIDKEVVYRFMRDCFSLGGPEHCNKLIEKETKLVKAEETVNIYKVGTYTIKTNMNINKLKDQLFSIVKIIKESKAMKLYLENEELDKEGRVLSEEIHKYLKTLEHAVKLPMLKKWRIKSIKCPYLKGEIT